MDQICNVPMLGKNVSSLKGVVLLGIGMIVGIGGSLAYKSIKNK